jgi:prevent-host-death family protein
MQTIKASEFKAKCLSLMNHVNETGDEIIITKNGVPVSKLAPIYSQPTSLVGIYKNQLRIIGDIIEPLEEEWAVLKETD